MNHMQTDFILHTTGWIRGEIFEAYLFGLFGLLYFVISAVFWKFGFTPYTKAVILPLAIVGVFFVITAVSGIINNTNRLSTYTEAYQSDPIAFVYTEKERVESFQYLYKMTTIIAATSFFIAICFFLFTNSPVLKAIGLALIIFGLTGLAIDYFSKERADKYYSAITAKIETFEKIISS